MLQKLNPALLAAALLIAQEVRADNDGDYVTFKSERTQDFFIRRITTSGI